jgi:hypothetical protein
MISAHYTLRIASPLLALLALAVPSFAGDAGTISAGKLAKDAKDFYGKTVTVKAEVEDVLGAHSFTLDEDAILAGADVLVLVPAGSLPEGLKKDDKVLVTGKVRRYVTQELETDYDWFKDGEIMKKGVKVDFESRPVLVATSVRLAPTTTGDLGATEMKIAPAGVISAGKLAREGKKYYGQTVTVKAEVEDVIDNRTFTLDEDSILAGADVLVLVPAGVASTLAHDEVVTVTGTVRPYVMAELQKDYDWFEDGKIVKHVGDKVDLKTRPVVVATSVRTSAGREILASILQ